MKIKPELLEEYNKYVEMNKQDDYSKACIDAGEVFMSAIEEGKSYDEAEKIMCEKEPGMTGFMVSMIYKAVAHFHEDGQNVKNWWNKKNGVTQDIPGIVNAAVVTFNDDGTMTPEIEKI